MLSFIISARRIAMEICRFCLGRVNIKSGFVRGKQRYKCKECGKHFIVELSARGIPAQTKVQALFLLKEGLAFRSTARILNVSLTAVLNWFKNKSLMIKQIVDQQTIQEIKDIDVVEIDEMWHYTKKNAGKYGYGLLLLVPVEKSLPSKLALVGRKTTSAS
jgi:transposase-like protein